MSRVEPVSSYGDDLPFRGTSLQKLGFRRSFCVDHPWSTTVCCVFQQAAKGTTSFPLTRQPSFVWPRQRHGSNLAFAMMATSSTVRRESQHRTAIVFASLQAAPHKREAFLIARNDVDATVGCPGQIGASGERLYRFPLALS